MAKLINALIMILMIEVGLFLFTGTATEPTGLMGLSVTIPEIPVLGMETRDVSFITLFIVALAILTAGGIIVGTFSTTITFVMYAVPAAAFLLYIGVIVQLGGVINSSLAASNPMLMLLVQFLVIVPLTIYYAMAVFEWVRTNR